MVRLAPVSYADRQVSRSSSMTARVLTASSLADAAHPNRDVGPRHPPAQGAPARPGPGRSRARKPGSATRSIASLGEGGFGQVYLARRLGRSTDRAGGRLHQGQHAHRRLAARGLLRPAARRPPARHPRLRRVPAVARPTAGALLPRAGVRAPRRSQRASCIATASGWPESDGAPRDRRHPGGARQAASRPAAASRPDAAQRLRLRRPAPQARRLRHRPSSRATAAASRRGR